MKPNEIKVKHLFLREETRPLFAVIHLPYPSIDIECGVVLCKPIWGERIRTHRIFFNLACQLAEKGYSVITCDYYGDGNSEGETLDLSFDGMVDDIVFLGNFLRDAVDQLKQLSLVGLRIGANCALLAEKKLRPVDSILMFEPLIKPIDTLKTALRANLASQMTFHKKIIKNRNKLIEDIQNDIPVNIDGFMVGKKIWQSFEKATPLKPPDGLNAKTHIFSMAEKGRPSNNFSDLSEQIPGSNLKLIEKEFSWTEWKYYRPKPETFLKTIMCEFEDG